MLKASEATSMNNFEVYDLTADERLVFDFLAEVSRELTELELALYRKSLAEGDAESRELERDWSHPLTLVMLPGN